MPLDPDRTQGKIRRDLAPGDIEESHLDLLTTCRELRVAVVAYSSLGCGFLTGQIKNLNELTDPFHVGSRQVTRRLQVTLEWLLAQDELLTPSRGPGQWRDTRRAENLIA
ncbi:hypothetical protein VTN96DRAFT_5610 [Rasamsonia emersonii]